MLSCLMSVFVDEFDDLLDRPRGVWRVRPSDEGALGHFIPAHAEEESPVGHAIEAGDHLGQIHGVVFGYETNRRAHFQLLSGGCRGGESNKRIKELLVVLRQFRRPLEMGSCGWLEYANARRTRATQIRELPPISQVRPVQSCNASV